MADRTINLKVQAQTAKAQADIKKLQVQLNNLSRVKLGAVATSKMTAGMANLGKQTSRTTSQMDKLGSRINAALNVAIVIGFTKVLANAGDEMLNITNKLKSVGVEAKNVGRETAFLLKTANATRTSIGSMATVYSRVKRSVSDLNYTTAQTQKATVAIAQSFQLAGTTAAEATNSTIQLAQGLSSGALRGDELRSVLEGNRVLSEAIAKELGVGVGQLRAMGAEGKITSDVVMSALLNDADSLNAKFGQLKPTFENSFIVLKNGLTSALGETTNLLGDAIGIKTAFMDAGKSLTEAFLDGRVRVAVREFLRDAREASARIKGFFTDIFEGFGLDIPDLSNILAGLATLLGMKTLRSGKGTAFTPIRADVAGLDTQVKNLRSNLGKGFKAGALDVKPISSPLAVIAKQLATLRKSMGKGFKVGETESSGTGGAGFLIAPTRQVAPIKAPDLTLLVEATKVVNGYANGVSRFFGTIATNIGTMSDKADFKLGVLDDAVEKNSKGLDRATKRYNKHAGAVNRLGMLYDGLSDKDVFAEKALTLPKGWMPKAPR